MIEEEWDRECVSPRSEISLVPRDWLNGPVFSPKKQVSIREVAVNKNIWRMGIPNPLTNVPSTQIDMTHVRVLLGVLSFWRGDNPMSMSIRELARRASGSFGGAYFKLLRQKLGELRDYWIGVELENGDKRMFPALSRVEITVRNVRSKKADQQETLPLDDWAVVKRQGKDTSGTHVQLDNVMLAPEFVELLLDWTQLMHVRLDVMRSLTSDVAQAIYLFIPSRDVRSEWVRTEACTILREAEGMQKRLIPLRLDQSPVPSYLANSHFSSVKSAVCELSGYTLVEKKLCVDVRHEIGYNSIADSITTMCHLLLMRDTPRTLANPCTALLK